MADPHFLTYFLSAFVFLGKTPRPSEKPHHGLVPSIWSAGVNGCVILCGAHSVISRATRGAITDG